MQADIDNRAKHFEALAEISPSGALGQLSHVNDPPLVDLPLAFRFSATLFAAVVAA